MSEVKVNKISPRSGTTITLGDSGDTITIPSGVTFDASSGGLAGTLTTAAQPNITSVGTLTSFTSTGIDDNATSTAITINSSEQVAFTAGTVSLPSITTSGDTNTGIFFPSADTIAFSEGGVEAMRINSNGILNTGKVIVRKDGASETEQLVILNQSAGSYADLHFKGGSYQDRARIRAVDDSFYTSGGSMKIETAGYNSTDGSSLETRMLLDKNGNISFYEDTGTTPKMFWDASAESLGIGTTSPTGRLNIATATTDVVNTLFGAAVSPNAAGMYVGFNDSDATATLGVYYASSPIPVINITRSDRTIKFMNDASERMRITSSGSVGIGTTSPSSSYRLSAVGGTGAVVGAFIETTSTDSGHEASIIKRPNSGVLVQFLGSGQVGSITTNGSTTTYGTSSDYRLKENVVDLTNATERLKQLQPKRFNFISDADTTVDGFIAHEVSSVVPEAIHGNKDEVDANGNPKYQNIDQSKLVPLLVKTIQELEARITQLENN